MEIDTGETGNGGRKRRIRGEGKGQAEGRKMGTEENRDLVDGIYR